METEQETSKPIEQQQHHAIVQQPTATKDDESDGEKEEEPVTYLRLGVDHAVNSEEEELQVQCGRIRVIEGLDLCCNLKVLKLIANNIRDIRGLEACTQLVHLELYQNFISKIENISHLTELRVLDLSFNMIRKIEGIEGLTKLEKLFLSSNKISKIEGIENLTGLVLLELGANRIRNIECLDRLTELRELFLGKNKITALTLPPLPHLESLSIQSNRITSWSESLFDNCPALEQMYLSHNALPDAPDSIKKLVHLETLDVGANQLQTLNGIRALPKLEELWANDNKISDPKEIGALADIKTLKTVYLERNPIQLNMGPAYRSAVLAASPWVLQLDALLLNARVNVTSRPLFGKVGQIRANAKAKAAPANADTSASKETETAGGVGGEVEQEFVVKPIMKKK
eukprot:GDKI01037884.1.p1 GENE.GDKI01037884.1~~GDKI01037884.1.p1  ORF type:complete len:402 (+),score=111.85 GDKI01037884.1:106-1311(+)